MKSLAAIIAGILATAVVFTLILIPFAGIGGAAIARTQETMRSNLVDLTDGTTPGVSEIRDSTGATIAWIYSQQRFTVDSSDIATPMKNAIVAIEDRRFYEHDGVDFRGALRAMVRNIVTGGVAEGASTIDQQYVKNYLLLVDAENSEEQAEAIETSYVRKLREMRMASDLETHLTKDEILTRYLNLVPFGNNAYGVEAAARVYFNSHANALTVPQAAMLAGIVQSSSYLDPFTRPDEVLERRNTVLDAMVSAGTLNFEEAENYKLEPLGIVDTPISLPNGCISAGDRGFFCDYVLDYLAGKGYDLDTLTSSSYTITTTLDPEQQAATKTALNTYTQDQAEGVASVMNVIEPGENSRKVVAMASSRTYGLNADNHETVYPQTTDLVGNGAGSVFKIFTAAVAMEKGMGINTLLDVPTRYVAYGLGDGGADNCPAGAYCVENDGVYPSTMSLRNALAQSPNTAFVKLIEKVGVQDTVDMAVKLGLRSYTDAGTFDGESSIADYIKNHNLGSFTLGPTAVNPLELSNVAATIASKGRWCEPNPILSMTDSKGKSVTLDVPPCEDAITPELATALSEALSDDLRTGTGAVSAKNLGWTATTSAKTGTTESNQSSAFLGFNAHFAAATYIYNDGTEVSDLCSSPVRQCASGNLYGGSEPTQTWISAAEAIPYATSEGSTITGYDHVYDNGIADQLYPRVNGLGEREARQALEQAGFTVKVKSVSGTAATKGKVVSVDHDVIVQKGDELTINISDGTSRSTTSTTTTHTGTDAGLTGTGTTTRDTTNTLPSQDDILNALTNALGGG